MQSNKLNIQPGQSVMMPCTGNGFSYESGTSTTNNAYIIVKPGTGGTEIRLKPGQKVNDIGAQGVWLITAEDPTATITGYVVIGDGKFADDNNVVTLGSSTNAAALPVKKQTLSTLTVIGPVTINTGAAQALVSDATQQQLRIRNTHATATLYVGPVGVTAANAAVVIPPGGMWIEEEAPGAAWYATSDTNATSVAILGLKL
jgi:hypothetical protein